MSTTFDVVVVGVGGMGAATLAHLAKRGVRALGVEQHDVPHALGSSHGRSRVIRKAYFEDARYVPLLERSYALWRALEEETGASLLEIVGCVNLGPRDHPSVQALLEGARAHNLAHELFDAHEIRARFPAFRVADDVVGVYEADGGILAVEACTRAHADVARTLGAVIWTQARVADVRFGDGVELDIARDGSVERVSAGAVVFAAGAWSPATAALAPVSSSLRVTREVQHWFAAPSRDFDAARFPVFIHFSRGGHDFYGLPPHQGAGVKVCRHGGGATSTPEALDRVVRSDDVDDVRGFLNTVLPALDADPIDGAVCMYTMTPDANFVVGKLSDNAVVLAGFSGHGYKMASAIGEIAADLVVDGRTAHDIAFLDPARFAVAG